MPLNKDSKIEEKDRKIAISGVSTDKIKGDTQTAENSTAVKTAQTESLMKNEVVQSLSENSASRASIAFPLRRTCSFTDVLKCKDGGISNFKLCKSEGDISGTSHHEHEPSVKECTGQQTHIYINEEEFDDTDENFKSSINQTESEVKKAGNKTDSEVEQDNQCRSLLVLRSITKEQRRRSFSDSTTLNTPRISTAEYLRETKSYTTLPHIDTHSAPGDDKLSSFVHRTSCFRIMPHLSGDCLANEDFPTVSVLSLSSLFENYAQNIDFEISSESEDSLELDASVESLLHSWRKPPSRPRSYSEPVSMAPELPVRTWSLPDMDGKRLSRFQETIYKVKASPSRLRFHEQALEKLKEETSFLSQGLSLESVKSCSSSVLSLVDNYDNEVFDQWFSSQESLGGDQVTGHWINRSRRNSITKQPSFSVVEEAEEERQSAVSLVNQVTEQVLSSCEVNISSESSDDQLATVEAAVKLWKKKDPGRRATLASVSPLTDSPKYASEIEQQAFRKIKKWKDSFAEKLNNVLGERFQEMAAKRDQELVRKKKPKVLNVPMNLSDKEMGQLKNNLLLELKRKSVISNDHEDLAHVPPPSALPIPRVKFPRRASSDQAPADLRAQMMKELSRRVSVAGDEEDALHCYKPSSLVPDLSKTLSQTKRQGVVYIPSGIRSTTLDPDSIRDLLSWHETERERLKAELEGLPQAQSGEKQVLIDRNDANKVLQSMMKIMEEIFTGTIMRFMGLGEPVSNVEPKGNEETKQTEVCHIMEDDIDEPDSQAIKPEKDLKLNTDVRNLPASGSTETLSSQSTAELFSSASSLTGISFSSSNEAFGICDQLKDGRASAAMKDKAADMPGNSSNVECRTASLEDALECAASNVSNFDTIEKPRESIKQNSGTIGKNDENHIRKLQAALQEETESEDLLKQRLLSLENELNSAVNNSDYWFSQCVKKREKIEELLSYARDMNSSNFELRQEINIKSRTIYEKDQEIQRLTESKTETEILLQEVRENLFRSNEEIERLKMFIGKFNEEKLRTVQTSQLLPVKALKPMTLHEKALKSHMTRKNNEKENFTTTHKGTQSDKNSSCNEKVLSSEVKHFEHHFCPISSYNVVTMSPNTGSASVCGNNVIRKSSIRDEYGRKEIFGAPLSNGPCSLRDSPIWNDPDKTKKAIRDWLSKVIRQAKAKLSRERKLDSFNEETNTDGSLKRAGNEKKDARSSLRNVVTSFKEKISKDVPRLPKKRKKNILTHSTVPITGEHDSQKTQRSKESAPKGCYDWGSYDTKVDNSPFALMPMDKRDDSLVKLAADVSTDTFDSMEPFADVFLANFEATDVLLADSIDSVEPFCEVLIPWQNSEDTGIKQTIEAFKRSITIAKQHPDKKVHLGKFLSANSAGSITLEEKKATAQTAVPTAGSEGLVIRRVNDCSLKRVHPERKPKQVIEENTANSDRTIVIKMRQEKPILDRNVEPSIYNRQKENRTPKQSMLANCMQSASVTHPRTLIDSVDGTQRDYSLGFVTGTTLSNEFSTVERDVERLLAELDSKTKNYTKFQKKQQNSPEKVLQLKSNDSKLVSSSGSNNNDFIDATNVEIKLNKEQLMNEFVHEAMMNPQQLQEENTTLKAGKETHLTRNEHYIPDRLKNVALQRLNQQRNERSVPFLCEKQDISADVCKQKNSFGTEFTQHRRIDTQRWTTDLLKGVGSLETTNELTDKDQGEVRDKGEVKHQNRESNSLASSPSRALHGASIAPVFPLVCKQNISKSKAWQTPKITLGQSAKNEIFKETACSKRNASCGSNRGQQRKAERDVRIAMWQAKNECLGGMLKERNIQDGLVDKFSEIPKLAKPWTEASQMAKQTRQVEKVYKDPHVLRDSKKEEKEFHFLVEMHRSAQDVLSKQAALEKAIQNCKNKVHFVTEEMETLQRKTTEQAM